ncbi:MAG: ABC transporter substrate-binding protein [Janthinobacterium lividum]
MLRLDRRRLLAAAGLAAAPIRPAAAQRRADTLRYVTGGAVNTLDPVMLGATQEATALSACTYDRLLKFGRVPAGADSFVFDFGQIEGELAEGFEVSPDGCVITLHLRRGAVWHDGSAVTAEDVKWSLDRAVSAPSMAKAQLATGSLTAPEQMRVTGEHTVEITLPQPDRLAVPNLATLYAPMVNSRLARLHATAEDPWATAWLKDNLAGGGAYTVSAYVPGQQVTLVRHERWTGGTPPHFRQLILQTVPEASTRSSLVERGDADITTGLQAEDLRALERSGAVRVVSTAMPTGFAGLVFNTRMPPFDQVAVRRALALAIPYEAIFATALAGRGTRLYGAGWSGQPLTAGFPQALPLHTDLVRARAALAEAGHPGGFETTLSYSVSRAAFAEPAAALIQEAFGRIGVRVRIEKLPDPQFVEAVTAKRLPLLLERSLALFPATEYFFRVFLSGPGRWNLSAWDDAEVNALLPQARFEPDPARADAIAARLIGILADQVPMAPIGQPSFDVVIARGLRGFTTWPIYYPDLRDLVRA